MSEDIRRLLARYADAVCRLDAEQWGSTWTDDGVWDMGAMQMEGREQMVGTWSGIMSGFAGVLHSYADGWADLSDDGTGTGRWYVHEYLSPKEGDVMCMVGYYDDEYRRVDGEWKFAKRTLTSIYRGAPDYSGDFTGFGA